MFDEELGVSTGSEWRDKAATWNQCLDALIRRRGRLREPVASVASESFNNANTSVGEQNDTESIRMPWGKPPNGGAEI